MAYLRTKKLVKVWEEIMVEMYKQSTPSADFLKLVEEAPLNDSGKKVIDYDAYELEREKAVEIFDTIVKKHKVTNLRNLADLSFSVYLGASPRFKYNKEEKQIEEYINKKILTQETT